MSKKNPSPNDQRSNAKNPNNPAQKASQDNRANQLNPNNPAYLPREDAGELEGEGEHAPSGGDGDKG